MEEPKYDVIVVGGGIAGASLSISLGRQGRKVLMIERDLAPPDTFRGELLQPGGIQRLKELGLESCIDGIDGHKCYGYVVYKANDNLEHQHVPINFPQDDVHQKSFGIGFHHGRFVEKLRNVALKEPNVTVLEGTVLDLIEKEEEVLGVFLKNKDSEEPISLYAPLTVDCTGAFSRLRKKLTNSQPSYKSHFVALLLRNCVLPYQGYGYVTLANPAPILCYQIATNEVRMLVAVPDPLPSVSKGELKEFLLKTVGPQLPDFFRESFKQAAEEQLKSVPCRVMPTSAVIRPGALCVGDSLNMRHPLTGGGMTVAFTDVAIIVELLKSLESFSDRKLVTKALEPFYEKRKNPASTINILSQALYDVFCGVTTNPALGPMKEACFSYFPVFGSECLGIVGGLRTNPFYLVLHFFIVALYTMAQLLLPFPTPSRINRAVAAFVAAFHIIRPLIADHYVARSAHRFSEVELVPN